jgi:putative flavoprotein involved in K+ transport
MWSRHVFRRVIAMAHLLGAREVIMSTSPQTFEVIVIGGGQSGLSVGYHLKRRGLRFLILDGSARIGDVWRSRWDSLRLFTPARFCSLDGLAFPAYPDAFPTKDEMADYLESYAAHFELPVLSGVRVERLSMQHGMYQIEAGSRTFFAKQVVVAMSNYQKPSIPPFAEEFDPEITQLHSMHYKAPDQLQPGAVLLAGAGNSGSELAMELAKSRQVFMAGRSTGEVPFRVAGFWGRLLLVRLVLRGLFHRVFSVANPIGRKVRPKVLTGGGPLIRVKARDLAAAGVERTARVTGVRDGKPALEDGRVLDVRNVIWCTGYQTGFSWIDLPILDARFVPRHHAGVVPEAPGLYFVGLHFLYSLSSGMIHGVGRDAERIARLAHTGVGETSPAPRSRFEPVTQPTETRVEGA